jgi:hypothetical protein
MAVKRYNGSGWDTVAGLGAQGAAATSSSIATWVKTASGGETSLSGNDDNSQPLSYTAGQELVYINGVLQKRAVDYVATTGTTITGLNALTASDVVTVWTVNAFSVTNAIPNSTITAKGNLIVGTGSGTYTAQAVGTNGQVLTANSAQADGVEWTTPNTGLGLMAYVTSTTSVSAAGGVETVALTTPSFTAVTGRLYKITYYEPQVPLTQNANPTTARIRLTNTSGTQYQAGVATNASATAGFGTTMNLSITTSLTAGSTVIVATLFFAGLGQTATRGGGQVGVLVVEDIGLA